MVQELLGVPKTLSRGLAGKNNFHSNAKMLSSLSFSHDHIAESSICYMFCDDVIDLRSNGMYLCVFFCLRGSLF